MAPCTCHNGGPMATYERTCGAEGREHSRPPTLYATPYVCALRGSFCRPCRSDYSAAKEAPFVILVAEARATRDHGATGTRVPGRGAAQALGLGWARDERHRRALECRELARGAGVARGYRRGAGRVARLCNAWRAATGHLRRKGKVSEIASRRCFATSHSAIYMRQASLASISVFS